MNFGQSMSLPSKYKTIIRLISFNKLREEVENKNNNNNKIIYNLVDLINERLFNLPYELWWTTTMLSEAQFKLSPINR